jgi:hypothetical protein
MSALRTDKSPALLAAEAEVHKAQAARRSDVRKDDGYQDDLHGAGTRVPLSAAEDAAVRRAYVALDGLSDPRIVAIRHRLFMLGTPGGDPGAADGLTKRAAELRKDDSSLSKSDALAQAILEQRRGR